MQIRVEYEHMGPSGYHALAFDEAGRPFWGKTFPNEAAAHEFVSLWLLERML